MLLIEKCSTLLGASMTLTVTATGQCAAGQEFRVSKHRQGQEGGDQQLRALAAPGENSGLAPSTAVVADNHL